MKERRIHTPEGVRDIYNGECARKNRMAERMKNVLKSYGYRDIQTPTFEFFDIFNQDKGSLPSNQMYKFFDREGNTLVLRPDITPSIARRSANISVRKIFPCVFPIQAMFLLIIPACRGV